MEQAEPKGLPNEFHFSVDEIASLLGVSKQTIYTLIKSGDLKSIRIKSVIRISKKNLEDYLQTLNEEAPIHEIPG